MKDFVDVYGNKGKKSNDGTLRVTAHYENELLKYVRVENHNGKTVAIRADKVQEVITMLQEYV